MIQQKEKSRHLNFNKFLQDRAEQISKFRTILQQDTKKKGHQSLPKTIRRRAMSHNRYRIPSKLRKNMEEELIKSQNMQKIPKCRKHIRKTNRLILSYKQRFSKIHWLNNHLWSARRMKMVQYYGYKVGFSPNDKCFRSSYRHFRSNCCLTNLSFYQCLRIKINNSVFPKNIRFQDCINSTSLVSNKIHKANLFRISQDQQLICPLLVIKTQNYNQQAKYQSELKCFFHPAALEEVKNCKLLSQLNQDEEFQVSVQKIKTQLYILIGPQWSSIMQQTIKKYQITDKLQQNFVRNVRNKDFYFKAKESNELDKVPKISYQVNEEKLLKNQYNQYQAQKIRVKTLALLKILNKNQSTKIQQQEATSAQQEFWKFYDEDQNCKTQFIITSRSKYTHKRKNKLSKQTKKKVITLQKKKRKVLMSEEDEDSMKQESSKQLESIKNQIKQIFIEENKKIQKTTQNFIKQKKCNFKPIMISPFVENLYQGCYILCSKEDNCKIWRILSHLNVKIIGLQEHKHIMLESQKLSFPEDYHQTKSFLEYTKNEGQKIFKTLKRRPPQKRANFIKVKSSCPFSLVRQINNKNAKSVFIQMVSRGRCFPNSYIYNINKQDLEQVKKQLQSNGNIGIVLSQIQNSKSNQKMNQQLLNYDKSFSDIESQLQNLKPKRKLIGRITSGGYLYSKSREGGVGFICDNSLNNVQINDGYVLIRKITSPYYYLGVVTKSFTL